MVTVAPVVVASPHRKWKAPEPRGKGQGPKPAGVRLRMKELTLQNPASGRAGGCDHFSVMSYKNKCAIEAKLPLGRLAAAEIGLTAKFTRPHGWPLMSGSVVG
jgi:hypothetical protein